MLPLLLLSAADAENWVRSGSHPQLGLETCVDRDSIKRDGDGYTHYRSRLCHWKGQDAIDATGENAVQCQRILAGDLTVFTYRDGQWKSDLVIDGSMASQTARFVCR